MRHHKYRPLANREGGLLALPPDTTTKQKRYLKLMDRLLLDRDLRLGEAIHSAFAPKGAQAISNYGPISVIFCCGHMISGPKPSPQEIRLCPNA
jgi:hypothetical protein